jgi:hypothetical protein
MAAATPRVSSVPQVAQGSNTANFQLAPGVVNNQVLEYVEAAVSVPLLSQGVALAQSSVPLFDQGVTHSRAPAVTVPLFNQGDAESPIYQTSVVGTMQAPAPVPDRSITGRPPVEPIAINTPESLSAGVDVHRGALGPIDYVFAPVRSAAPMHEPTRPVSHYPLNVSFDNPVQPASQRQPDIENPVMEVPQAYRTPSVSSIASHHYQVRPDAPPAMEGSVGYKVNPSLRLAEDAVRDPSPRLYHAPSVSSIDYNQPKSAFAQFARDDHLNKRDRDVQKWNPVLNRLYCGQSDTVPYSRFSKLLVSLGIQQQCSSLEFYRLIFSNLTQDVGLELIQHLQDTGMLDASVEARLRAMETYMVTRWRIGDHPLRITEDFENQSQGYISIVEFGASFQVKLTTLKSAQHYVSDSYVLKVFKDALHHEYRVFADSQVNALTWNELLANLTMFEIN